MKNTSQIYLFTNTYPYGVIPETFLETEILVVGKLNISIVIIPLNKSKVCRKVAENIRIDSELANLDWSNKGKVLLKMLYSKWLWKLLFQKDRPKALIEFYQGLKYLYGAFLIRYYLLYNKGRFEKDGIFYSYWFNHTPLGLAWAMQDDYFKNYQLHTRAHGFDVYGRDVRAFIPYREEALKKLKAVWVVSKRGAEHLKQQYSAFSENIYVAHLGVLPDSKKNQVEKVDVSFVSCSSVIPVKRVMLIYDMINLFSKINPEKTVSWTHIGGGSGYQNLQEVILTKSPNMEVYLKGSVDNETVRRLYRNTRFDLFVNLSSSEGIPVAIMEAIRFGIPVIATNVGGNSEIVRGETGILISSDFKSIEFVNAVLWILKNAKELRESTIRFYEREFNAEINYRDFYNQLLS